MINVVPAGVFFIFPNNKDLLVSDPLIVEEGGVRWCELVLLWPCPSVPGIPVLPCKAATKSTSSAPRAPQKLATAEVRTLITYVLSVFPHSPVLSSLLKRPLASSL